MSSFMKKIIDGSKKIQESYSYIKENFMGIFPIGVYFKSYQNNFIDTLASCIDKNYSTIPEEMKKILKKNEIIKVSFKEDDTNSFLIIYNLLSNDIFKNESNISLKISIVDDELNR